MTNEWAAVFSRVRSALKRRGSSNDDADDFLQEAFVRLTCYQNAQAVDKPEAFLMRTALNLSADAFRTKCSRGEHLLLEPDVLFDAAPSVEDVQLSRERMVRMNQCLRRLSAKTRAIFLAHRIDGLSYQEIGKRHGVSISTVEKHVARAVLLVTSGMEGWYP
jgi:RNA polymerase sigma factor (sigma-70 family)